MSDTARIGTWNLAWPARRPNERSREIERRIASTDADVFVATECQAAAGPDDRHRLDAGPDWGYRRTEGRRKVELRSKQPWERIDLGDGLVPAMRGRICAGRTATPIGVLTVVGVCIPWADAHVRTGRSDTTRWAEHLEYLAAFPELIQSVPGPVVVAGDFNQQLPRTRVPERVHGALIAALNDREVVTAGLARALIDHIAVDSDLRSVRTELISPKHLGKQLTDHLGSVATISGA